MVNSLKELIGKAELAHLQDPEERFTISGVGWQIYEGLLTKLADSSQYRITYLDGILELVSPSFRHEKLKKRLATLIEFYFLGKGIEYVPMGSPTLKNQLTKAGVEPDECYCIGEEKEIPDLVIEVVITSGSINKLQACSCLGVAEVWFWERNGIKIYHLREATPKTFLVNHGYEQIMSSKFLPDLNISLLERCVLISHQNQAIAQFEQGI